MAENEEKVLPEDDAPVGRYSLEVELSHAPSSDGTATPPNLKQVERQVAEAFAPQFVASVKATHVKED